MHTVDKNHLDVSPTDIAPEALKVYLSPLSGLVNAVLTRAYLN